MYILFICIDVNINEIKIIDVVSDIKLVLVIDFVDTLYNIIYFVDTYLITFLLIRLKN